ncbi:MAG: hypothetical protein WAR79_14950 [Melioribacteraceae bacterium]
MQKITENDLFKFVFYPETLSKNKYDFINDNKQIFKNDLDFLQNLNVELQTQLSDSLVEKLNKRIAALNNVKTIVLKPDKNYNKLSKDEYCLAAASTNNNEQTNCKTFKDQDNFYLLKLIFGKTANKLYLFTKDVVENKKIEITFLPSNSKILIETNELPISFEENENINQIVLNFPN